MTLLAQPLLFADVVMEGKEVDDDEKSIGPSPILPLVAPILGAVVKRTLRPC